MASPRLLIAALVAFMLVASSNAQDDNLDFPTFTSESCLNLPILVCHVQPVSNFSTTGVVYFSPVWVNRDSSSQDKTCYTRIQASIQNLPGTKHGFHVHTYGDLSFADNGTSTGGHFADPANNLDLMHGYPDDANRHWGDFGNLTTNDDGVATYNRIDKVIRLGGILGRAVTIHEENDKGPEFQPSGKSGSRIGFGVIGFANPDFITL